MAEVKVENLAGHKFPSGVGFRRAFLTFEVLDANGDDLWVSGRTDPTGVLVGPGRRADRRRIHVEERVPAEDGGGADVPAALPDRSPARTRRRSIRS